MTWRRWRLPTPFVVLLATESGLVAFFLIHPLLSRHPYYGPRVVSGYAYWYLIAAAFVPYTLAVRAQQRGAGPTMGLLFGGAVALYLVMIPAPAQMSQDLYQSLLYGKMALREHNPYIIAAATMRDPWRAWTLWDGTLSVYGPAWTLLTAGVVRTAAGSLTAAFLVLKATAGGLVLLATWALSKAARVYAGAARQGWQDPRLAVLAFAYNPMVLFSTGLGAHADVAVAAALACAVLAERTRHPWLTTALVAVAALVKAYAALTLLAWLICLARRRGVRTAVVHAVGAVALAASAYQPFWEGTKTFAGLWTIGRAASASLAGTIIRLASGHPSDAFAAGSTPAGTAVRLAGGLILVVAVIAVARSPRTREEPWRAAASLLATYVLVTPWYLYSHLIGLVALVVIAGDQAIAAGTLTFSATSLFVGSGGLWFGLVAQTGVRYLPPLVVARSVVPDLSDHDGRLRPQRGIGRAAA